MEISVSYITSWPKHPLSPQVTVTDTEGENNLYTVDFCEGRRILYSYTFNGSKTVYGKQQWYTAWEIIVRKNKKVVFRDIFDLIGKTVHIHNDAHALGDNLAWMPYVEEFRKKHACKVICSTYFNSLFYREYPEITFVQPLAIIPSVYTEYYIGTTLPHNPYYSPIPYGRVPLQRAGSSILGLVHKEIKPKVTIPIYKKESHFEHVEKSVCISTYASTSDKEWRGNWQEIVDFLIENNYRVKIISKEHTNLRNIENKTGELPLSERIIDLHKADFFIGCSSGLAWLSWAVGTHVIMISDYTPIDHEFKSGCIRLYSNKCRKQIIDAPIKCEVTVAQIKKAILSLIK